MSQRAIAKKFDTTKSARRHRMKKYGIKIRNHDKRPENKELKRFFLKEGLSEKEIAKIYKAHPRTVRCWLSDCGLIKNNLVQVSKKELIELYWDESLMQK